MLEQECPVRKKFKKLTIGGGCGNSEAESQ